MRAKKGEVVKARKPGRLSAAESITVAQLLAKNVSVPEIARQLQVGVSAIRARCVESRALLEAASVQAAGDWVRASEVASLAGNHRPAKELLEAIEVVEPKARKGEASPVSVAIGFKVEGISSPERALPDVVVSEGEDG